MKKIKGLVKMDEERISQRILYVMVGLVVAVFLRHLQTKPLFCNTMTIF